MAVPQVDIDDEALAEAMSLSGETTKEDTVNRAPRDYVDRHRRIVALERYAAEANGWDYEGWRRLSDAGKRTAG